MGTKNSIRYIWLSDITESDISELDCSSSSQCVYSVRSSNNRITYWIQCVIPSMQWWVGTRLIIRGLFTESLRLVCESHVPPSRWNAGFSDLNFSKFTFLYSSSSDTITSGPWKNHRKIILFSIPTRTTLGLLLPLHFHRLKIVQNFNYLSRNENIFTVNSV